MAVRKQGKERLVPLLIDVERRLDQELNLDSLASRFGASKFHFHRTFSDSLGETPKGHVERLRLEKAAMLLAITDDSIVDIGLAVGFEHPETFSRNFKKFIGYSPSGYRRFAKAAQAERLNTVDFFRSDRYTLSRARFVAIPPMHLLAVRKMGPYGAKELEFSGDGDPWHELAAWARRERLPIAPGFIGIYYDDPTLTPGPLQRSDICVPVERAVAGTADVRCLRFDGGLYGVVEYVGPIDTLINGFRGLADEIRRSEAYVFRDGPPVEFLREASVGGRAGVHRLEICFPVRKSARKRPVVPQESS